MLIYEKIQTQSNDFSLIVELSSVLIEQPTAQNPTKNGKNVIMSHFVEQCKKNDGDESIYQ